MEEHININHTKPKCKDCGKIFDKHLYSNHKKKCQDKKVECSYCSLEMHLNELHQHEYMCGSKTEKCHNCGSLVPIMGK